MRVLFAAGGTGGHIIPALTLANHIRRQDPQAHIVFVGTSKGMEKNMVPKEGYPLELIEVGGVKGKGLFSKAKVLMQLPKAFSAANSILKKHNPDIVFGIGGYASGPVLLLASLKKIFTGILEPNAVPGFSNRVLARFVSRVYIAFEEARSRLPEAEKAKLVGNILRPDILAVPRPFFQTGVKRILIFGGSQGAQKINKAVLEMLPLISKWSKRVEFIHQTGKTDRLELEEAYRLGGFQARVAEFIDDMAEAYQQAHLVIARAGSSVLEIAAAGRPSILIPFPYAADDHQLANAKVLEKAQAAKIILDADLNGKILTQTISELLEKMTVLKSMSEAALTLRKDRAVEDIYEDFKQVVMERGLKHEA